MAISIDDLMLVHITEVRPSFCDGRLVMKTGGSKISCAYRDDKIFTTKRDFSCPHRVTLHWSLNGITRVAGIQKDDVTVHGIPARYAIIEPISELKEELWGGGFDDLYSLGDHVISQNGYLLVPEDLTDLDQLSTVANVVTYKGYVEGFTNNDMRELIASVLIMLGKPRMVLNGLFLNEEILSRWWKVTFPSRWASLTDQQLVEDEEFIQYNREKMHNGISGVIRVDDNRIYVCKEVSNRRVPTGALFEKDGENITAISEGDLEKMLKDASYVLPEFGVIHPHSVLHTYEEKFSQAVSRESLSNMVDEIGKFIVEKKPTTTSLDGLNQVIDRIKSRL